MDSWRAELWPFLQDYGVYLALTFVLFIGLARLLSDYLSLRRRTEFTEEFRAKFHRYCDSDGADCESYSWLVFNSHRMQNSMGSYRQIDYRPPFASYMIKNHPVILNFIPEIRHHFEDRTLSGRVIGNSNLHGYMKLTDETLIRFLGVLDEWETQARRELRNPVKWFATGIKKIVAAPLHLLSWLGLLDTSTAARAESNVIFRAVSGLTALVGFLAAIVDIANGWEGTLKLTRSILPFGGG
ncbi:MAG: hypothetical protein L0219_16860 [Phycisphaerales bacterium]|nr:hypothetical protein [Phycisphaerales bacterium]